jgi:hypothetical protein
MPYGEVWVGVFCVKCHRPLLIYNETAWKLFIEHVSQSVLRQGLHPLVCPDKACMTQADYALEQFVHFRVEQIPQPR